MRYDREHSACISFPLGGLGAGCVGLSGSGRLVDWEMANHPNKRSWNRYSHFAVRAEEDGRVLDARVLNGDLEAPYMGITSPAEVLERADHRGFGYGATAQLLPGMPHFRDTTFDGAFPIARMAFSDPHFPGSVTLAAYSSFIPQDSFNSSLPCAFFEFTLRNTTSRTLSYTLAGSLSAAVLPPARAELRLDGTAPSLLHAAADVPADAPEYGELALAAAGAGQWSGQACWYRGSWMDALNTFWNDFSVPGSLKDRRYDDPERGGTGTLAGHATLAPGGERRLTFVLAWYFPNRVNDWRPAAKPDGTPYEGWRNWYATQFPDARAVARYALEHRARLRRETFRFQSALFDSTLPPEVLDAVSANLSTLVSPTCLRLENGAFYAFEGSQSLVGSCEGSCTHVWNYAYALPFLFPDLERSMREMDFTHNFRADGGLSFRLQLPLGRPSYGRSCADGQFGGVLKTYREWKISGDTEWLRRWFPAVRRSIEYAWSPDNADAWDPDRSGVLTGRQHHTLDVELFGPNAWLTGFYLAALEAGARMADAVQASETAALWRDIAARGRARLETELWNGEYYVQRIDLKDRDTVAKRWPDAVGYYWNDEVGEIKYQIADGCLIDQVLAQWHADLLDLGDVFRPERVDAALRAIYRHNFRPSLREYANFWRVFGLNDEAGTVICAWPRGERPAIPVPYATETMHGFEYQAACHMILRGQVAEGLELVRAVRDRYDGARRNPWNEIECGSNYARSMACYALLNAFAGFRCDRTEDTLGFAPRIPDAGDTGEFRVFWSVDGAWGRFRRTPDMDCVEVLYGRLPLRRLRLDRADAVRAVRLGDAGVDWTREGDAIQLDTRQWLTAGKPLCLSFAAP